MSAPETVDAVELGSDDNGTVFAVPWDDVEPYTDQKMLQSAATTSMPDNTEMEYSEDVGPIRRVSSGSGLLGSVDLKSFALRSSELATTIRRIVGEMYRNEFPRLLPRFQEKCTECGAEFEKDVDECRNCGSTELRSPRTDKKNEWKDYFRNVNKEGTSLTSLMKFEEFVQAFYGVSTIVVRKSYDRVYNPLTGRRVAQESSVDEIVHAHPLTLVPVTDGNGRIGGWWTCPFHRGNEILEQEDVEFDGGDVASTCEQCNTQLREVYYVEIENGWDDEDLGGFYFDDEVVQWSRYFPLQHGIDGMSPIYPLIRLQAMLLFDRQYDMAFLDPENSDLPNKMLVIHTTNPDSLRAKLTTEEEQAKANPLRTGRLIQQIEQGEDASSVEVIDLTPKQVLQNRDRMVERAQSQIRSMFGMTDAMENELKQSGGLNSEGEQLEITSRAIAEAIQDTRERALVKLEDVLGMEDYTIHYVDPQRDTEQLTTAQMVTAIQTARREDVPYVVENGDLDILDHEFDPDEEEAQQEGASEEGGF